MSRSRSRSRDRGRGGGQVKISIRNIDPHTDEQDLEELFAKYGEMEDIYVPRDDKMVCNRGYAFVTFMDHRDAGEALAEDCTLLRGQRVAVAFAHRRPGNMRPPRSYVPSRDGPGGLLREWVARVLRKRGQRLDRSRSPYRRSWSRKRSRPPRRSYRSRSAERSRDLRDRRRRSYSRSRGRRREDHRSRSRRRRSRYESPEKSVRRTRSISPGGGYKRSRSYSRDRVKEEYRSRSRSRVRDDRG